MDKELQQIPCTEDEWRKIAKDFEVSWKYPHCVGACDGKHIVIQNPKNSGSNFFNYKGTFSIVLMAIADANYCFTYADIGCQSRISDGGVFRETTFYKKRSKNNLGLPPHEPLPGSNKLSPYVLVADDAFPLQIHIMKPFPGYHEKGSCKRHYNYRLSRARRVVENAFGLLASVFRVFRRPKMLNVENAEIITTACIYLHNFLRKSTTSKALYSPQGTFDTDTRDGNIIPGSWRSITQDDIGMKNLKRGRARRSTLEAKEVRDEFMRYFTSDEGHVPWQDHY
ncbi:uncharacterized protein LOC112454723 isoform X2 [Temnothorax curvispinosus]|uniref:Uncharacterized protein LOC112454723 isoform X2 n=1 Tax=Temnothorax curvispinosus TaxID=300111 RepID=A0A6J1PRU7_9HYME|nr:uncharacterized protein LOC112454723 isoform X2 [Temnothorax curvispinosus]